MLQNLSHSFLSVSKGVGIENELFLLSNTTYNSVKAQATCSLVNGKMAQLDKKQIKDILLPIFVNLYMKGNCVSTILHQAM